MESSSMTEVACVFLYSSMFLTMFWTSDDRDATLFDLDRHRAEDELRRRCLDEWPSVS